MVKALMKNMFKTVLMVSSVELVAISAIVGAIVYQNDKSSDRYQAIGDRISHSHQRLFDKEVSTDSDGSRAKNSESKEGRSQSTMVATATSVPNAQQMPLILDNSQSIVSDDKGQDLSHSPGDQNDQATPPRFVPQPPLASWPPQWDVPPITVSPVEPGVPPITVNPVRPSHPPITVWPIAPLAPHFPTTPAEILPPITVDPITPIIPVVPVDPPVTVDPITPIIPVVPPITVDPVVPVDPPVTVDPITPIIPVVPPITVDPVVPVDPPVTVDPVLPVDPPVTIDPITPIIPVVPPVTVEPAAPIIPTPESDLEDGGEVEDNQSSIDQSVAVTTLPEKVASDTMLLPSEEENTVINSIADSGEQ